MTSPSWLSNISAVHLQHEPATHFMIILNLQCANHHRFEGWFASRAIFDEQAGRGEVRCALCESAKVTALPSGPRVLRNHENAPVPVPAADAVQEAAHKLYAALSVMARKAENVGTRFPEEARRIHYEEAPARNIRGQASQEETRELLDEGILVLPAPVPPESETH
jgi:hypothetical protein